MPSTVPGAEFLTNDFYIPQSLWFSFCIPLFYSAALSLSNYIPPPPFSSPVFPLAFVPSDGDTEKKSGRAPALEEFTICWVEDEHICRERKEVEGDGARWA